MVPGPSTMLPPPRFLERMDAGRLIHLLQQGRQGSVVAQLLAAQGQEGVSVLARDIAISAATDHGLRVLLLAAEADATIDPSQDPLLTRLRRLYQLPADLRQISDVSAQVDLAQIGDSRLAIAAPRHVLQLSSEGWGEMLDGLQPRFDLTVIDSPPLQRSYTGIILGPRVTTTAIVLAAESTRATAVRLLRDRLIEAGGTVAGVILNKRRFHIPQLAYERL